MFSTITTYELLHTIQNIDELLSILKPFQVKNDYIYQKETRIRKLIKTPQYVYIDKPKGGMNSVYLIDRYKKTFIDTTLKPEDSFKSKSKTIITKLPKVHITDFINHRWVLQKIDRPDGGIGALITLGTLRSTSITPILVAYYNNHRYNLTYFVKDDIMTKLRKEYSSYERMKWIFS